MFGGTHPTKHTTAEKVYIGEIARELRQKVESALVFGSLHLPIASCFGWSSVSRRVSFLPSEAYSLQFFTAIDARNYGMLWLRLSSMQYFFVDCSNGWIF